MDKQGLFSMFYRQESWNSDWNPSLLTQNQMFWQLHHSTRDVQRLREEENSSTYIAATFHESVELETASITLDWVTTKAPCWGPEEGESKIIQLPGNTCLIRDRQAMSYKEGTTKQEL